MAGRRRPGYIPEPYRLPRPSDLKALPLENVFQPVQRQIIRELAGYDVGQQSWPRHALIDRCFWFSRHFHLRFLTRTLAPRTGVLFAHVLQAFETARNVLNLPTLLRAHLFALDSAARTNSLFGAEFVDVSRNRKIFEVGQMPSSLAPLHPPQLVLRLRLRGQILWLDRL